MGVALQNLDHLVQLPHGCGEQNMVLFAPIVYVLQYLEKTRQLSPEIKDRAAGFLRNGEHNRPTLPLCLPPCPTYQQLLLLHPFCQHCPLCATVPY